MCGRYQSWIEDDELLAIIEREKKGNAAKYLRRNEVFPGEQIPVLYGGGFFIRAKVVIWGYPMLWQKQTSGRQEVMTLSGTDALDDTGESRVGYAGSPKLLINARSETVMEKRLFRDDAVNRRVAVPTSGYYEWSPDRQKYRIGSGVVYLAAMTHRFEDAERCVILTTMPTEAIRGIHDRMPLVLGRYEVEGWLYDDYFSREKLKRGNTCMLTAEAM